MKAIAHPEVIARKNFCTPITLDPANESFSAGISRHAEPAC